MKPLLTLLLMMVLAVPSGRGHAEEEPLEPVATPAPAASLLTLHFVAADLLDVVQAISAQTGIDIVLAGAVEAQVTAHLNEQPVDLALDLLAGSNGLAVRRVGGVYIIGTREALARSFPEPQTTRLIALKRLPVTLAREALLAAYPELEVAAGEGLPALVVHGAEANVAAAGELVQRLEAALEAPLPTGAPVVRVYRLRNLTPEKAEEFVAALKLEVAVDRQDDLGALILRGAPETVEMVEAALVQVDDKAR